MTIIGYPWFVICLRKSLLQFEVNIWWCISVDLAAILHSIEHLHHHRFAQLSWFYVLYYSCKRLDRILT